MTYRTLLLSVKIKIPLN